ncbi:unnamed protein product [Hydatigera taeniaeformis]|uniref:Uncharacterized protein n=1 Tax=Hydatigena taeniaeformis TaxID=6205 RepID=A0A3P7EZP0_HYDTA|nr:unnamed protein product [Hydatigera taeniaeformis]
MHAAARGKALSVFHWLQKQYPRLVLIRDNMGRTATDLSSQRTVFSSALKLPLVGRYAAMIRINPYSNDLQSLLAA